MNKSKSKSGAVAAWTALCIEVFVATGLRATGARAGEVTAVEIDRIAEQARHSAHERAQRLKVSTPDALLEWVARIADRQRSQNTAATGAEAAAAAVQNANKTIEKIERAAAPPPVPPPPPPLAAPERVKAPRARRHRYQVSSVSFEDSAAVYGVQFDRWMRAELRHALTSQDRAPVRLYLTEAVQGKNKSLPAGVIFAGSHSFDARTGRLFVSITSAYLPDGGQLAVRASVYDAHKNYGLPGTVMDNIKERLAHGGEAVGQTMIGGLIDKALPATGTVASESIGAGIDALRDGRRRAHQPRSYLVVRPQAVLINVEAEF